MEIIETENYSIPAWAVTAVEYGDFEGLTPEEADAVRKFAAENLQGYVSTEWEDESHYSSINDILNGEGQDVVGLTVRHLA